MRVILCKTHTIKRLYTLYANTHSLVKLGTHNASHTTLTIRVSFYRNRSTLTPEWISYHHKVWDESTYPFPKRLYHWSLGVDKYFLLTVYWACDCLSMRGLKLMHISKWDTRFIVPQHTCFINAGCLRRVFRLSFQQTQHGRCLH